MMPSKSKAQHNLMEAVAHNAAFSKRVGIPQSVGKDFESADKGKKFGSGGTRADSQAVNQPKTNHGDMALFKQGGRMATKMNPGFKAMMAKKKEGMDMAKDGMKKPMAKPMMPGMGMKKGGMKKMAAGGLSSGHKSADGVASKGKTKAMMPKMAGNQGLKKGGMAKKYC